MRKEATSMSPELFVNEDNFPHVILRGEAANLAPLKHCETVQTYFSQRGDGEPILSSPIACRLSGPSNIATAGEEENNLLDPVEGEMFVSSSQVLFAAKTSSNDDWAIGATCILMHAMTEEPELSIYLQLQEDSDEILEVSMAPVDAESCQIIFKALCKLVSAHPIEDDDDDAEQGDQYFGQDDLIWAPSVNAFGDDGQVDQGDATEEERQTMLDHLDSILVVKPEFEIKEGQFEDAEEGPQ